MFIIDIKYDNYILFMAHFLKYKLKTMNSSKEHLFSSQFTLLKRIVYI
jgi:hypothetical protein